MSEEREIRLVEDRKNGWVQYGNQPMINLRNKEEICRIKEYKNEWYIEFLGDFETIWSFTSEAEAWHVYKWLQDYISYDIKQAMEYNGQGFKGDEKDNG